MHVTPTGGYTLPKQTVYERQVAKGRKEHFTGHIVLGAPGDERLLDIESHDELMVVTGKAMPCRSRATLQIPKKPAV
ncbi:hypothetical protein [Thetidibacter halocola]|uniref:Uncharacterized protein n=1 Tax=Thetidibacter halocola TaxID=2827239 RepID=A0A8J8BA85_9RHOB|nr:hypothetical protein [Thetidibacter halocola]MBS0126285.1 hypothetical protein [Thetidibacter halocola]